MPQPRLPGMVGCVSQRPIDTCILQYLGSIQEHVRRTDKARDRRDLVTRARVRLPTYPAAPNSMFHGSRRGRLESTLHPRVTFGNNRSYQIQKYFRRFIFLSNKVTERSKHYSDGDSQVPVHLIYRATRLFNSLGFKARCLPYLLLG